MLNLEIGKRIIILINRIGFQRTHPVLLTFLPADIVYDTVYA